MVRSRRSFRITGINCDHIPLAVPLSPFLSPLSWHLWSPPNPSRDKGRDEQDPTSPGSPSTASPLTLTGRLTPSHEGPRHLLSAAQDTPAAALGRVALHWGEASILRRAGWGVARAGSPGGSSTLEYFTEARALMQRQASWALCP